MGDGFSFSGHRPVGAKAALPRLPQNAGGRKRNLRRTALWKPTAFFAAPGYSEGCPEGGSTVSRIVVAAVLNFCVNVLLLAGTGHLAGRELRPIRLLAAAILGAVYAAGCMLRPRWHLGALPWHLGVLTAMALLCYGRDIKTGGVYILLTMALSDAVAAAGRGGIWQLPLCLAGVQCLGRFAFGTAGRRLIPVEIADRGRTVRLKALYDTGNELRDPVTGESVLVIGSDPARQLTGLTEQQLHHPLETLERMPLPGLRLVPYQAVGETSGLLLAMRFQRVRLGSRSRAALVAFAPQSFGSEYQALAGGTLC